MGKVEPIHTDKKRQYYLDWLRVTAFGLLFVFHSLRLFDTYPWHLKNNETNISFNYIIEFMHSWRMYIIFLVSGAGTYFAMQSKKENFLYGRIKRLVIPYFFGILILIPPQKFYEAIQQSSFEGSYLTFMAQLPQRIQNESYGFNMIWTGNWGYHIWYLAYLFIQTLLFLPLFKLIITSESSVIKYSNALLNSFAKFWVILIPFILLEFLLRPIYPEYLNWADFATFSLYFVLGFVIQSNSNIIVFIENNTYRFLLGAVVCWSLYLINKTALDQISLPAYSLKYAASIILKNINSLAWVMAITGLGKKFLDFNHRLLSDLNQGILPFYILHQTLIIVLGYYIIALNLTIIEKLIFVFTTSFVASIGIYRILKRINLLRVLFGMRIGKKVIM